MAFEHELVAQVTDWYQQHIVAGVEPPMGKVDNAAMAKLYPTYTPAAEVDLTGDTNAVELWHAYRDARDRESAAKAEKEAAGAELKKLIADREVAKVDGNTIATWSNKKGKVDWPALVAALVEKHGFPAPNPDYKPAVLASTKRLSAARPSGEQRCQLWRACAYVR